MKSKKLQIFIISIAALFIGAAFFVGYFLGHKNKKGTESNSSNLGGVLFSLGDKKYSVGDLPAELREKVETLLDAREGAEFAAETGYYQEVDRILRMRIVEKYLEEESKRTGETTVTLQNKLLSVAPAVQADARALFEASDPSANPKDFEKIRPNLETYLTEIKKREKFDAVFNELLREKKAEVFLPRPRRERYRIHTEGFPVTGKVSSDKVVVNFTDYLCETCAAYNIEILALSEKYRMTHKFIFIPFPYTRPERALALARGAMCAARLGKFLDYHMVLVTPNEDVASFTPLQIAERAKIPVGDFFTCYKSGTGVAELLNSSQIEARNSGVFGTPVSFLDGKIYEGQADLERLREALGEAK